MKATVVLSLSLSLTTRTRTEVRIRSTAGCYFYALRDAAGWKVSNTIYLRNWN